jgi:hypothetical protein
MLFLMGVLLYILWKFGLAHVGLVLLIGIFSALAAGDARRLMAWY